MPNAQPNVKPSFYPSGHPSGDPSGRPSSVPTLFPTNTAAPTESLFSFLIQYSSPYQEYLIHSAATSFGKHCLFGKVFVPGNIFYAYILYLDNCGAVISASAIDIPLSWHEQFSDMLELPNQQIEFIGEATYNGKSIGLFSSFDQDGRLIATRGLTWLQHVAFTSGSVISSDRRLYIGYSGEGINYHDILAVLLLPDGTLAWARQFASPGQDEALAFVETDNGFLLVGIRNAGVDCFVMLLNEQGHVQRTRSLPKCALREVVKTKNGGFTAAGEQFNGRKTVGLVVVGSSDGEILKVFNFEIPQLSFPVLVRCMTPLKNGNFGVVMDSYGDAHGSYYSRAIVAEVNIRTGAVLAAHFLGNFTSGERVYIRSLYASPHNNGFSISGYIGNQYATFNFFLGELTNGLTFPDYKLFTPIPSQHLISRDVTGASTVSTSTLFQVSSLSGYSEVQFSTNVYRPMSVTEIPLNFRAECVPSLVSPSPTTSPSSVKPSKSPTIGPTTRTPSVIPTDVPTYASTSRPSVYRTVSPTSAVPTKVPATSKPSNPGDTISPSLGPTAEPSFSLSVRPSLTPSFSPSVRPSNRPTISPLFPPTFNPIPKPSGKPSIKPTSEPRTALPSGNPTANPTEGTRSPTKNGFDDSDSSSNAGILNEFPVAVNISILIVSVVVLISAISVGYYAWKNLEIKVFTRSNAAILAKTGARRKAVVPHQLPASANLDGVNIVYVPVAAAALDKNVQVPHSASGEEEDSSNSGEDEESSDSESSSDSSEDYRIVIK